MNLNTRDWRSRIDALMQAARDFISGAAPPSAAQPLTSMHAELFVHYVQDLRRAKDQAQDWWEDVVATEQTRTHDRSHALRVLRLRFPAGPVGDLRVVAVIRQYWLACTSLNASVESSRHVRPEEFLMGRLIGGRDQDLALFLADLPYWPIGMDADGNWV